MSSMWSAISDLDYYESNQEPELESECEPEPELPEYVLAGIPLPKLPEERITFPNNLPELETQLKRPARKNSGEQQ